MEKTKKRSRSKRSASHTVRRVSIDYSPKGVVSLLSKNSLENQELLTSNICSSLRDLDKAYKDLKHPKHKIAARQRQLLMLLTGNASADLFINSKSGEINNPTKICEALHLLLESYRLEKGYFSAMYNSLSARLKYWMTKVGAWASWATALTATTILLIGPAYGVYMCKKDIPYSLLVGAVASGVVSSFKKNENTTVGMYLFENIVNGITRDHIAKQLKDLIYKGVTDEQKTLMNKNADYLQQLDVKVQEMNNEIESTVIYTTFLEQNKKSIWKWRETEHYILSQIFRAYLSSYNTENKMSSLEFRKKLVTKCNSIVRGHHLFTSFGDIRHPLEIIKAFIITWQEIKESKKQVSQVAIQKSINDAKKKQMRIRSLSRRDASRRKSRRESRRNNGIK